MPGFGQLIRKYSWAKKEKACSANKISQRRNFTSHQRSQINTIVEREGSRLKQGASSKKIGVCESSKGFLSERGRKGIEIAWNKMWAAKRERRFGVLLTIAIKREKKNKVVNTNTG